MASVGHIKSNFQSALGGMNSKMEESENEAIETMQKLGLTFTEARIYLALVKSGQSSVKTISKSSGVARAEIYRSVPSLQKLGLIEKILNIPIKFKAMPLQNGLNILLNKANAEHLRLEENAKKLASSFRGNHEEIAQEVKNQFFVIPGKEAHIKWLKNRYEKIQSTDGILTWKDDNTINFFCDKEIRKAQNRGVKSRIILYVPENLKAAFKNEENEKHPCSNSQKRIVFNPPLVLGGCFDNKEVIIPPTLDNPIQTAETVFCTTNPSILALFQKYFETLWKTAEHTIKEN